MIPAFSSSAASVSMWSESIRSCQQPVSAGNSPPSGSLNAVLPTPRIEYEANKNLTIYGGGVFKESNFRVDHNFATQVKNHDLGGTVLTYSEIRAGVGVDWKVTSNITLTAETGYQPYRTFDFYRADVEFDQDNSAPYGTISLHGSF